jgi:hypothetical protein
MKTASRPATDTGSSQDVIRPDVLRSTRIRQRAGHFLDAVMRTGGKVHLIHRVPEESGASGDAEISIGSISATL